MKIVSLKVENFRAINRIHLTDLQDMVVIAGPNGCGKSCILDAIRLFKSGYGGYQPGEWQHWLNEFQINVRNPSRMASVLRDKTRPSVIQAEVELAKNEKEFIQSQLDAVLEELAWKTVMPGGQGWARSANALATELRAYQPQVQEQVKQIRPKVLEQLAQDRLLGMIIIHGGGITRTTNSELLELVFSMFHPREIGVIDYHGAHRNYAREELGGINLNLDQEEERLRTTSLYNLANKYSNVKSEMAAEYVKQTLRDLHPGKSRVHEATQPMATTLQELFSIFFPGKTFLGPVPTDDGNLGFPVEMADGSTHDINDLSSGEKEILFGYLRLRTSAPRYSVILLDEPELHLNPGLVRGLPQFYRNRLARDLDNQIWMVTHSDAFLREALGHEGLQVFHMRHAAAIDQSENQMRELQPGDEVESIILEMVGNLAAYSPGAKVVFFEGENSDFDIRMVSRLFPSLENEMNLVSGGNRFRVEALHDTLQKSVEVGQIPIKIYSVVDKDSGPTVGNTREFSGHFTWDLYHIENYLLEPSFIAQVLQNVSVNHEDLPSEAEIERRLRDIASGQIGKLVLHKLSSDINAALLTDLKLGSNHMAEDLGRDIYDSISQSLVRMNGRLHSDLSANNISERVTMETLNLTQSLETEDWKKHFRGRDILKVFAGDYVPGMRYGYFRDLIISQMSNANYQPGGMKSVLDQIVND